MTSPRRHRRAVRPATGGDAQREVPVVAGDDDTDQREPPVDDAKAAARQTRGSDEPPLSAADRWLLEQRPPHWD